MADADPWAGMVDPRAALKAAREAARALADSSRVSPEACESFSSTKTVSYETSSSFSSSSRGHPELSQASGNSAKDRKETCSSSLSMGWLKSAPGGGRDARLGLPSGDVAPAKAAKLLENRLSSSDPSQIALAGPCESFAVTNTVPSPIAHLSGPAEWRDGLARLDRWPPPCEGFRSGEWDGIHRTVSHFMDHCAVEAVARGWTTIDLFGVHRAAGAAAVDSCGALMLLSGRVVTSISERALTFGHLVYRKRPMPQAVPVWDFVGEAA